MARLIKRGVHKVVWTLLALGVHAAAWFLLPSTAHLANNVRASRANTLDVDVVDELQRAIAPAAKPSEPTPPPQPRATPQAIPATPTDEPPAPAQESPVDFDNIVLTTNDGAPSGWATQQASGVDREGPIGTPAAAVTGRSVDGVAGGVIGGTGTGVVTDMGSLQRQPEPPSLKSALEKFYPPDARASGLAGYAVVRLTVHPSGEAAQLAVAQESPTGAMFAETCIKALRGARWKPALDKSGRLVSVRVSYKCAFETR